MNRIIRGDAFIVNDIVEYKPTRRRGKVVVGTTDIAGINMTKILWYSRRNKMQFCCSWIVDKNLKLIKRN